MSARAGLPLVVEVPGIGTFRFRARTYALDLRIAAEVHRMLGGTADLPELLVSMATQVAYISVLALEYPPGFDVNIDDPLSDGAYEKIGEVFRALSAAEDTFHGRVPAGHAGGSAAAGEVEGDVVPGSVQSGTE